MTNLFADWYRANLTQIKHKKGCRYYKSNAPINETLCTCYEEAIWNGAISETKKLIGENK